METVNDRFWSKVDQGDAESCWSWLGSTSRGYGRTTWNRRTTGAHRVAYELTRGPIPPGLVLDHVCRNRACVNPMHLEVVSQRTNILRGTAPSAVRARQTHCKNGHELTGSNLKVTVRGGGVMRQCRTCINRWKRENRQRVLA